MCGIVGYVGARDATQLLLEGLHRLEYRGYDSAGIAVAGAGLHLVKTAGRVADLRRVVPDDVAGTVGIAHTRWATHGEPTDRNAHPHVAGRIAIVHNGVFENSERLRRQLTEDGVALASDTDSEVLAHLVARSTAATLEDAVREALGQVEGTYGVIVMDADRPGELVAARRGSPVVLGVGEHEMLVASDVTALVRFTQQVIYLDDDELATVTADGYRTSTMDARSTTKSPTSIDVPSAEYELGDHPDFMRKEMREQPDAVDRCLRGRLDRRFMSARLDGVGLTAQEYQRIRRVKLLGCGSAYYAGQVGAGLVEELARIPADAEPASEFRYRNPVVDPDTLYVAISQSGETLDTLAAVQELKRKGGHVIGVVNAVGSTIARECGSGIFLHAGPEVSVAATKSFTAMTVALALLALDLGRVRDLSITEGRRLVAGLSELPAQLTAILGQEDGIAEIAARYAKAEHMFFLGRVRGWPVAREGAQKLKEISYLHAEAYQASELKHGPLALINPGMPTVFVIPDDELLAKNTATVEEIKARGGPVIAVTDADLPAGLATDVIRIPKAHDALTPITLSVPLQLFAYHLAKALGRDIDRPRNLAKSVTVE
ncbi:glutamine--fructose-6-phosphate transaminase (isomerizing) [Actinosynnema sp. NPDC047251]|uniref:Glutamine--fructose-6-phosphate aminotransferase [isomerizing] n=1 Tax=Saccharothrix espanaensis (strain ATCC 51144 / DSM 44229 / JCM 9112 / NBRC 15066 / NRRL 15764) TaxID=1179773 RepID=K0JXH4_SACES|nr:glutamine--fructose-6-phosphate transaminase (isomerizing) [Saccharothrix espanaensis]CCH30032.1 Glucosamine-fructose-6-phosphate aminotransferase [isomerizing] [Saccharothrix espanaensis DSM 44229]